MEDYEQTKADKIMNRIVVIANDYTSNNNKTAKQAIMQIYNILKRVTLSILS